MRIAPSLLLALPALFALPHASPRLAVDDPVYSAIDDPDRLESDRARDANRRPQRVLDFFDVKRGQTIADLMAGDGYYTEILSRAVGPAG